MEWMTKLIEKIKTLFHRKEEPKLLEKPKTIVDYEEQKNDFGESLKVDLPKASPKKIETLVCPGDGLGIQPPMKS